MSLQPNKKKEVRRTEYKLDIDGEDSRRRRENNLVEFRKCRYQEDLLKRRKEPSHDELPQLQEDLSLLLSSAVADLRSNDIAVVVEATRKIRKLVSKGICSPINKVVQAGVVPLLVKYMAQERFPQLQLEAACALSYITSGTTENTKALIDHGAVPVFIKTLSSSSEDVREQAVWALGNIARDKLGCDIVLRDRALIPLLYQFKKITKLSLLRTATWTLSNFCRGISQHYKQVKCVLLLLRCLIRFNDEEVLIHTCWAVSYLSAGNNEYIQIVIEARVCPRLVELLLHSSLRLILPALLTVGHIVTGNTEQTQTIISLGALPSLLKLLSRNITRDIKIAICCIISNITAGPREHIQAVIEADLIIPLAILLFVAEFEVKKEAACAIANASAGGDHEQIKFLASQGCILPLCDMLNCSEPITVLICLGAVEDILKAGQTEKDLGNTRVNMYRLMVDDAEGRVGIERLQNHADVHISKKAVKIIETYWS